ncbi:MFS transporter [Candidatus Woesebacteria bacterium]|nr:MFS transporter [Candidatus Woesebacteria bacterium]
MKLTKELIIIFVIKITEVLGFSLILPLLPFYAKSFGATPFVVSLIPSVFSFFQFFSAPIMGKLSDQYGRRPLLIISQFSTFLSFVIFGLSNSLFMIFLSRIVDGLLGSNFTITQAYIADVTDEKDRSKAFGLSGVAFGIGFLIGPAIGGYLSKFGIAVPAFVAAGISLLSIIATAVMLPETVKRKKAFKIEKIKIINIKAITKYLTDEKTAKPLFELFSFNSTHVIWTSNFALFSGLKYGFTVERVGYVLAYVGLISIIMRGAVLPKLIDRFEEHSLKVLASLSIVFALLLLAFTESFMLLFVAFTFFAFGGGLARPLMTGTISRSVGRSEQGSILGVSNSMGSLVQIIGPMVGGLLLTKLVPESLMIVSAAMMLVGLRLILKNGKTSLNT